jgi:hypothetical protein
MIAKHNYEDIELWSDIITKLHKITTIGNSELVGLLNELDSLQRNLILT